MKTWLIAVLAIACGLLGGTGASIWQLGWPGSGDPLDARELMPDGETSDAGGAELGTSRVAVGLQQDGKLQRGVTRFDFGRQSMNSKGHAEFVLINEGNAPLKLRHGKGDSSCECVFVVLSDAEVPEGSNAEHEIPPGERAVVKLAWDTVILRGPFRHHAIVRTNDPKRRRVKLEVTGTVVERVTFSSETLWFGDVHAQEGKTLLLRAISYDHEDLQVKSSTVMDDHLADWFEITHEKLAAKDLPAKATSGCLISAKVKPGLRLGSFQTRICVTTNAGTGGACDFDASGSIVGDIAVARSPGWVANLQTLNLGQIDGRIGGQRTLYMVVRGPRRDDIRIKVHAAKPAALKASVGKPHRLESAVRWPVTIEVPKGTPVMNHQQKGSYGKVILETANADEKEMAINVSFGVK